MAPTSAGQRSPGAQPATSEKAARATGQNPGESPPSGTPARSKPGAPAPGQPVAPAPTEAKLAPVVIGHVGSLGGVYGVAARPILGGVQIWAKYINSRGGLNGHEVKLVVFDDGGDPARHRAQLQEAVERHGAIAFLVNSDAVTGRAGVSYLEERRVPHLGTMGGIGWAYESPMYFPHQSDGDAAGITWIAGPAQQLVPAGKTKLATLVCVEASACSDMDRLIAEQAKSFGFELVSRGKVSVTQPDFTAECLSARNAGAEAFFVLFDQNSLGRLASSCARQGFKPTYSTAASLVDARQKDDPNLKGMVAATNVMPWFETGTPATDEFQAAVKAFGGGLVLGVGTATGWTGGKLLEQAARAFPASPTNEDVLRGLWAVKNETFGGLTGPNSFVQDHKPVPFRCWFNLVLKDQWSSPDGFKMQCR